MAAAAASACLVGFGTAGSAPAASTFVRPAVVAPGAEVEVTGRGFRARALVRVRLGEGRTTARTTRTGRFSVRLRAPARPGGRYAITVRTGRGATRNLLRVSARTPSATTTDVATSSGLRARYSPTAQYAGRPVRLLVWGLAPRQRLAARLGGGPAIVFQANRRGRVAVQRDVPPDARGGSLLLRARRHWSVRAPLAVLPDPVAAAAGDIACGAATTRAECKQMITSDLLLKMRPQVVLPLGDTQYEAGQIEDFRRFYDPSWGRLKHITRPAVGNHEYGNSRPRTCGDACGYFDYFNGDGRLDGPAGRRGEGWYAFDLGAWRIYALNSNCDRAGGRMCAAGGAQEAWLRGDLAAHPRRCTLMYMHHPLFTSDTRDFDEGEEGDALRPLWRAFHEAGGDIALVGHSHFYERFRPQDPDGRADPARGIRQFIVGTGGRNLLRFGAIEPGSEVRDSRTFGVLRLVLRSERYEWNFVPEPGRLFVDAGEERCR